MTVKVKGFSLVNIQSSTLLAVHLDLLRYIVTTETVKLSDGELRSVFITKSLSDETIAFSQIWRVTIACGVLVTN